MHHASRSRFGRQRVANSIMDTKRMLVAGAGPVLFLSHAPKGRRRQQVKQAYLLELLTVIE